MIATNPEHECLLQQTERLQLRPLQERDAEAVYYYRNQPDVSLFQGWTPESANEVKNYAVEMRSRKPAAAGHWYQVIIELKNQVNHPSDAESAATVIGDVAFCIDTETNRQAELGVALDNRYQGCGYAQEAIRGLTEFLFIKFELHRIHVSIDPQNTASRKLFTRLGFRQEGHLISACFFKGKWCDDIIMAQLKSEWEANN